MSGKSIIGSIVGTRQDLADVFALHLAGRTKVIAEERKLDDVNSCIEASAALISRATVRSNLLRASFRGSSSNPIPADIVAS
jgi:D-arabinose 1-dehydrogenase-like Zn-dependent alcohol dehydrogenase